MEPEHGPLEDYFPLQQPTGFQFSFGSLPGCTASWCIRAIVHYKPFRLTRRPWANRGRGEVQAPQFGEMQAKWVDQ